MTTDDGGRRTEEEKAEGRRIKNNRRTVMTIGVGRLLCQCVLLELWMDGEKKKKKANLKN